MRVRPLLVLAGFVAALAFAAPTGAAVWHVHPGESIQAAVDAANPGDTIIVHPGVYRENVTIRKNRITLRGAGHTHRARLRPAATPLESPCTEGGAVNGICAAGAFDPDTGEPGAPVRGTRIINLNVAGFSAFGVVLFNANNSTVRNVVAANNESYGISGFLLHGVHLVKNVARDNGEPGLYIGDSPEADAVVKHNKAFRNGVGGPEGIGILIRDASHGVVKKNRTSGNCAGIVFADTDENPDPVDDWVGRRNRASRNNGACTGEEDGAPPFSGIGILALGTHDLTLRGNRVFRNAPSGFSAFHGGIVLVSSAAIGGADPTDNRIVRNRAFGNDPVDVFWDETGTGNRFVGNRCGDSDPSWICD